MVCDTSELQADSTLTEEGSVVHSVNRPPGLSSVYFQPRWLQMDVPL